MICEFGSVAVVPFPFVDMSVTRRRPALVLSKAAFNDANGQTLLAMITTARRSAWPSDIPISDAATAGLVAASIVRWKIFTLPNDLIVRTIGRLAPKDSRAVRAALGDVFPR